MAKQSGLHQIKGKVGEFSYYSQTGVQGGIIRAINQALSAKVKTDEAFANTRLNNAEFGQAGRISSVLAKFIEPKFRPMVLPFSQSKLAKQILEIIKLDDTNPWGQRNINDPNGQFMAPILSSVAKNDFSSWGISISKNTTAGLVSTLVVSTEFNNKLISIGASSADIKLILANSLIGKFNPSTNKYYESYARGNVVLDRLFESDDSEDFSLNWPSEQPVESIWQNNYVGIVIVLPRREVNGTSYILQEHCTFHAYGREEIQNLPTT